MCSPVSGVPYSAWFRDRGVSVSGSRDESGRFLTTPLPLQWEQYPPRSSPPPHINSATLGPHRFVSPTPPQCGHTLASSGMSDMFDSRDARRDDTRDDGRVIRLGELGTRRTGRGGRGFQWYNRAHSGLCRSCGPPANVTHPDGVSTSYVRVHSTFGGDTPPYPNGETVPPKRTTGRTKTTRNDITHKKKTLSRISTIGS